jgi:DNA-binding CsgD family transcriptional regulator
MAIIEKKIESRGEPPRSEFDGFGLSPREKDVAVRLLRGYTYRQISAELGIAESTVNGYSGSLYKKLGINSRSELFIRFGVAGEDKSARIQPPSS